MLIVVLFTSFNTTVVKDSLAVEVTVKRDYILVTNGNYEAIGVDIYYSTVNGWEHVERMHIAGQSSKSFDVGSSVYSAYGYTTKRTPSITRFYSDQMTIY